VLAAANRLVVIEGMSKVYVLDEIETHALSEIDVTIEAGDFVAIEGPSGSGKTTLLSIIGLLDEPTEGSYSLNGNAVEALGAEERSRIRNRDIGFVFQSFNLIGDLTVAQNIELPLSYRGLGTTERRERVQAALERVGMSNRARHYPSQLSGGQQQRAAVARAIVGDPLLLLADEPTGNLDSRNGENIMELLCDLNTGGATIIMVTHDPRYAAFASRTVHLFDGRKVNEERHGESILVTSTGA
jgi:putative ABC transport system ATP-binding protein